MKKISVEIGNFEKGQDAEYLVEECKAAGVELDLILHRNADAWSHQSEENNEEVRIAWQ